MGFYKFIKTKGEGAKNIGYFVPNMHRLDFSLWELKLFGLQFLKERLSGWTIWYVTDDEKYTRAIETLDELKKTHIFTYKVSE